MCCFPKPEASAPDDEPGSGGESDTRQKLRKRLREGGWMNAKSKSKSPHAPLGVEIMAPPGMEEMTSQLQGMFQNMAGNRTRTRKLRIRDARKLLCDEEAAQTRQRRGNQAKSPRKRRAERHRLSGRTRQGDPARRISGPDVSREGVQRDLLPLVEGSTVSHQARYGAEPITCCSSPPVRSISPNPPT